MTTSAQLKKLLVEFMVSTEEALKEAASNGCTGYRVREFSVSGEVMLADGTVVQQTVVNEPLTDGKTITTEEKSTQAQTSKDSMSGKEQRGGDKIGGRTVTTTED